MISNLSRKVLQGDECPICPICLDSFGTGKDRPFMVSNCSHRFHETCIHKVIDSYHAQEHNQPRAPCKIDSAAKCMTNPTAPCPECRIPIKKSHVKLDTMLLNLYEGFCKKIKSTLYGDLKPRTMSDERALFEEALAIMEDLVTTRTDIIKILQEEINEIKKSKNLNLICIGIDIASGILCIPLGPFVSVFGTVAANGIRIYATHIKLMNQKTRTQQLEKLIKNYDSKRESQKLQIFLKLYSDSITYPSNGRNLQGLQEKMMVVSIAMIPLTIDALFPLRHVSSIVKNVVGVSLCVGSAIIQGVLALSEAKKGNDIITELENIVNALEKGKKEMNVTMREMAKIVPSQTS